jgi:hypothetical protein
MASEEFTVRLIHSSVEPHFSALIEANKENLIKAAVADPQTREELLKLNEQIKKLAGRDPSLVAAWGLGCGGHCAAPVGGFEILLRR